MEEAEGKGVGEADRAGRQGLLSLRKDVVSTKREHKGPEQFKDTRGCSQMCIFKRSCGPLTKKNSPSLRSLDTVHARLCWATAMDGHSLSTSGPYPPHAWARACYGGQELGDTAGPQLLGPLPLPYRGLGHTLAWVLLHPWALSPRRRGRDASNR